MEVIRSLVKTAGKLPKGYLRIGDDVAVVPSRGKKVVLKVDMLVEGTDVPTGMTYRQAARKAVAMCVSDFAAKGVKPDSFLVSFGLRRGTSPSEVIELGKGLRDAGSEWGVLLVGGDTNESSELIIDCAMMGSAGRVVGRGGAKAGDLLVVSGRFGYPSAGLKILMKGARASPSFRRKAVSSVLMPTPNLNAGVALAPYLSAAMDSSDGLARSLHTLADSSGVGFTVTALPVADGLKAFADLNQLRHDELVLAGGEEYLVVGTMGEDRFISARRAVERAGGDLLAIGRATEKGDEVVLNQRGRISKIKNTGWTHLG